MKKIFLFWICISFLLSSNAQLTKDNWLMGGSGTVSRQKEKLIGYDIKNRVIQLSPDVGYFLLRNFQKLIVI